MLIALVVVVLLLQVACFFAIGVLADRVGDLARVGCHAPSTRSLVEQLSPELARSVASSVEQSLRRPFSTYD